MLCGVGGCVTHRARAPLYPRGHHLFGRQALVFSYHGGGLAFTFHHSFGGGGGVGKNVGRGQQSSLNELAG